MKRVPEFVLPLAFSALATIHSSAFAWCGGGPASIFMNIDGIQGESENTQHKGEIDVLSWSWQLSQSSDPANPIVRPISFIKCVDAASSPLYAMLLNGTKAKNAILARQTFDGNGNHIDFLVYTLTDVTVSAVSTGGVGTATGGVGTDSGSTETISLNFSSVCIDYTEVNDSGGVGSTTNTCWTYGSK